MESRFHNTLKNSFFALVNQIIILILNILNRTIFIKILGVDYLGVSGLFSDILMMLSLSDLGLGTAMVYSYYKPISEGDDKKIAQLTFFYKRVYSIIAGVVLTLGLLLLPFLKYLVNLDNSIDNIYFFYILLLLNTVASYLFVYKTSILTAAQKNYIISKTQTVFSLFKLLFQILILMITKSYGLYLLVQIITTVLNNIALSSKTDKLYPFINNKTSSIDQKDRASIYENIKSMFLYKVAQVFFGGTDNTLISVLVGTIWVGYYSNYNMVINAVNTFTDVIYRSATASIGNVIALDNEEKKYEVFKFTQLYSFIITTITTVCISLLLTDFVRLWVGESFIMANTIFICIMANYYFNSVIHPIWSFREACGLYRRTKYIMVYAALLNLLLSCILGFYFGISGILFASLLARLSTYFWYEPKILFEEYFNQKKRRFYIPLIKNLILTLIITFFMDYIFSDFLINGWFQFIIKLLLIGITSTGLTILIYIREPEFMLIVNRYFKNKRV